MSGPGPVPGVVTPWRAVARAALTGRARGAGVWPVLLLALLASPLAALELHGHRGARGLAPENTLPGFAAALAIGVDVLELDLALSADGVVVVSHDPLLDPAITRGPDNRWLPATGPAIRRMRYPDLTLYDVGRVDPDSELARRFPGQQAVDGTHIPRLVDVFELVRRVGADRVRFNIELKTRPVADPAQPPLALFARRVVETLREAGMSDRVLVQGFDWRALAEVRGIAPDVPLACLTAQQSWMDNVQRGQPGASPWTAGLDVDRHAGSVPRLVAAFGCAVWSPYWREVDADSLAQARTAGLRVVVWTVNERDDIDAMIDLGVDGIISDYPDRVRAAMASRGMRLPEAFGSR